VPWKTHHTAVAVVPPEEVWGPIQAIRRRHDRQVGRWMPHINLLYPFRPRAELPAMTAALSGACASVAPFSVTLAELRFFPHGSGRCTLWLTPQPAEELRRLHAALLAAFPDCDDLSRFPAGYTPHLSVGQSLTVAACERLRAELQQDWRPIVFPLTEVVLLARDEDGPFGITQRARLGPPGAFSLSPR
jgi:2'-5' RNA ligase